MQASPSGGDHSSEAVVFFYKATAPTKNHTLSLHDALPIYDAHPPQLHHLVAEGLAHQADLPVQALGQHDREADRKSTRLNSSHSSISYAVFCLKKKSISVGDVAFEADDAAAESYPPGKCLG